MKEQEVVEIVQGLNLTMSDDNQELNTYYQPFKVECGAYYGDPIVTFMDVYIWGGEDDDRKFDEDTNEYEDLRLYIIKEAKKVLTLTPFQLINFSDYGSLLSQTGSKKIKISWWHYKITEDVHHIFFITERRLFLGIYKKYLAGIKDREVYLLYKNNTKSYG